MNTTISTQLGALELNAALLSQHDASLEATVSHGPLVPGRPQSQICRSADDEGALEQTVQAGPPTTYKPFICRHVEDGALEATGVFAGNPTGPRWTGPCCGRIDDGALEEAAGLQMGPQTMRRLPNTLCVA